jgi:hypothetical protein
MTAKLQYASGDEGKGVVEEAAVKNERGNGKA